VDEAGRQKTSDNFWFYFRLGSSGIAVIALGWLVLRMLYRFGPELIEWIIEWHDRPNRFMETRSGTATWVRGPDGELIPVLIKQIPERETRALRLEAQSQARAVTRLTASGSVLSSPIGPGITTLAVQLLKAASATAGDDADTIPGWRNLEGWSSNTWQRVISALEAVGAVEIHKGVGTFVTNEFQTVGNLLYAVEMRQIKVRPAPTAPLEDSE
jgi:hypothetical protein